MDKMIVGIDYTQDGNRFIDRIEYCSERENPILKARADDFKAFNDEVYIVDFNPNHEDFINEIVLKGCRI